MWHLNTESKADIKTSVHRLMDQLLLVSSSIVSYHIVLSHIVSHCFISSHIILSRIVTHRLKSSLYHDLTYPLALYRIVSPCILMNRLVSSRIMLYHIVTYRLVSQVFLLLLPLRVTFLALLHLSSSYFCCRWCPICSVSGGWIFAAQLPVLPEKLPEQSSNTSYNLMQ